MQPMARGTFQPRIDHPTRPAPSWLGIADLNGDGQPDAIVLNDSTSKVGVLLSRCFP